MYCKKSERRYFFPIVMGLLFMLVLLMKMSLSVYAEEYEYDELNRVIKVIYDDGTYIEYKYDDNGNLLETIKEKPEADPGENKESETEMPDLTEETSQGTPDAPSEGVHGKIPTGQESEESGNDNLPLGENTAHTPEEAESSENNELAQAGEEIIGQDGKPINKQPDTEIPKISETKDLLYLSQKESLFFRMLFEFLRSIYGKILLWILKKLLILA